MANPNDATFHARITADASDFIQQTKSASAALEALVAQSKGASGSSGGTATKSAESEAKRLGASMRAEQEKTTRVVQDNIKEENRLRAEGVKAAGLRPSVNSDALQMPEPPRLIGPVREGALGAVDTKTLRQGYVELATATRKYGGDFAIATANVNKGLDTTLTNVKRLSRLEGPVRSTNDTAALRVGLERLNAERKIEIAHFRANIINARMDAQAKAAQIRATKAAEAQAAKANRQQMDAMVTGRYALYDLSEAYTQVGMAGMKFLNFFKQAIMTAAEFETAFTSVEGAIRPLPEEVEALRQSLIDLTREIPLSFTQISEIATLGAQMGVAAGDIEDFTKTVASFSAITGASIDETAQSFGRIASLADVPVAEFDNLASAITYAGVNAVATEEQILALTQSIAASSRDAGFTADEIVGLGTALASLGVQPEQARGVLLRVFGQIGSEIDKAGEKLEVYSRISGMSADEIKSSWGTDPKVFFGAFLQGLKDVENTTEAFSAAGFVDTREINVLQRLSQNMNVYNDSMQDAIKAYGDGTYLGERYAMTIDNLAAKIVILQNNVAAFGASIGMGLEGPLKTIIDALSFALVAVTKFAKTPLGTFVVGFTAVTAAIVTGFTLIKSLGFRATAQLFAMRTAMIQMSRAGVDMNKTSNTFRDMVSTMMGSTRMIEISKQTTDGLVTSTAFMTKKQAIAAGQLKAWTAAAGTATIAGRGLAITMRAITIASGFLAVASLVGVAAEMLGAAEAAKKLEGLDFNSLSDAIKKDTEAMRNGEEYYGKFTVAVKKTADELRKSADAHDRVKAAAEASGQVVEDNTLAFGKNTQAAILNSLANNEALKNLMQGLSESGIDITKILEENGGSWKALIQAGLTEPGKGAMDYLKSIMPGINAEVNKSQNEIITGAAKAGSSWYDLAYDIKGAGTVAVDAIGDVGGEIDSKIGTAVKDAQFAGMFTGLTNELGLTEDGLEDVNAIAVQIANSFEDINKEMKLEESIDRLGSALRENGNDFDTHSESGRANIQALQDTINAYAVNAGDDADLLATNLSTLMSALGAMGINATLALDMVTNAMYKSGGVSKEVTAEAIALLTGKFTNLAGSAGTAQTALEKLQDAIEKTFAKLDRRLSFQDSLSSLRDSLLENGSNFSRFSEGGRKNIGAVRDIIDSLAESSNGNSKVFSSSLNSMKAAMIEAGLGGTKAVAMVNKAIKASGSNSKASASQVRQFANALKVIDAGNVISAADAISSLSDSVMGYLDAKWMLGNTQMEIAAGWEDIANSASNARDEIEDVSDEIAGFAADRGILEYQLGIALKYGDTLRANELRAEIADLNSREAEAIAGAQGTEQSVKADLLSEQQALQSMVGYYVQMGAAEVIGAKNKEAARVAVEKTVLAFSQQATAAGVSEENVKKYAGELTKALTLAGEINKPVKFKINSETKDALNQVKTFTTETTDLINSIPRQVVITTIFGNSLVKPAALPKPPKKKAMGGLIAGPGTGNSDSIPAMLSNGEFVIRSSAVKTYGLDFMNSLNRMQVSRSMPVGSAGGVASSSSIVHLSPEDRQLLRAAIDRPVNLYTDNAKIAQSANQGNVLLAQRGIK